MRTETLFFVSSLVGADLLFETAIRAEAPARPATRNKPVAKSPTKSRPPTDKAATEKAATEKPAQPPVVKEDRCQIDVKIENLRKSDGSYQGQLCYTLFKGKEGFPDKSELAVINQCIKVEQAPTLSFKISDRECNHDYAIAVLHDENFNRQLDKNIAIPKEGVGMSNNPSFIRVNAPPYDDVKFMLQQPSAQQTIRLHYWP